MSRPNSVIFNLAQGEARISGTVVVPVGETGTPGEIETGGGTILRPLTFGERTRIVGRSGVDVPAVSQGVLQVSRVRAGADSPRVLEVLALALAGADQEAAPPFAEAMLQVAGASGWSLPQINDAEAAEIDRLAVFLAGQTELPPDDGWNRIVFPTGPTEMNSVGGDVLEQVGFALANQLLRRAGASRDPEPGAGPIPNSTWPSRFQYHQPGYHQESSGPASPSIGNRSPDPPTPIGPGPGDSGAPKPRFEGRIPDGIARPGLAEIRTAGASKLGPEDSARPSLESRKVGSRNEPAPAWEQGSQPRGRRPGGYVRIQVQGDSWNSYRRPSQEQSPPQVGAPGRISAAFVAPGQVNSRTKPAPGSTGSQQFRAGPSGAAGGAPMVVSSPVPPLVRSGPAESMVLPAAPALVPDPGPSAAMPDVGVAADGPSFRPPDLPEDLADTLADFLGWEADLRGLAQ